MTKQFRLSLLLLVALLLAACDTTGGPGGSDCQPIPAFSASSIEGFICNYDADKHGTQIFAYAAPGTGGLSHYDEDPNPVLIEGELMRSGNFHIDLPTPLDTNGARATICETASGALAIDGLIVSHIATLYDGSEAPERLRDFAANGGTFGLATLHDYQYQYWIYSPKPQTITATCVAVKDDPPVDVTLNLSTGWNTAVLTKSFTPSGNTDDPPFHSATFKNGVGPEGSVWMVTPIWRLSAPAAN